MGWRRPFRKHPIWSEVGQKPEFFPPAPHTHPDYVPLEPVVLGIPEADMTIEMGSPLVLADDGDLLMVERSPE